jgi:SPP1 family holin
MNKKISTGTVVRTFCLALALVNQFLVMGGHSVLPIEDAQVEELITLLATTITSVVAWWKNNSFTQAAITADETLQSIKSSKE